MSRESRNIVLVVEDELSEAVMRKVIAHHAETLSVGDRVFRSGGYGNIKTGIAKYKNASRVVPHIVLTDLDQHECPVSLMASWRIDDIPATMLFRVAVRSIESWLLADRIAIAEFLAIPSVKVHQAPESLTDCKRELISLARRGRGRRLVSELCPEPGSAARQGPLYNAHMVRFVKDRWRVEVAVDASDSLARTCRRITEFEARLRDAR